ncbi:MAG TPA: hypothetical protein VKV26_20275 [Dehalococcoidia bacterium]|nr:hypothetical protein [Dehalococcoidia bacterium]
MRAEDGLRLDLDGAREAIGRCDVLVLGFRHLAPRVLFDTREGTASKPLFRIVPPVNTPKERFAQLRRLRPDLGEPERFLFIQWPLGLESLVESGIWSCIVERCRAAAQERGLQECEGLLERLTRLDQKEVQEAIDGESYRTLWPPSPGQPRGER